MTVRLKPATANGHTRLVLPKGRHLEQDGWFVAADVDHAEQALLVLRVWTPANHGYRLLALDAEGGDHGSVRASRYEEGVKTLGLGGQVAHTRAEGRRLVYGGDPAWEVAAEISFVGNEEVLFLRVWLQRKQRFSVYAIDPLGIVRAHAAASTNDRAVSTIWQHLAA